MDNNRAKNRTKNRIAFENIRFSTLLDAGDVSRGGTSARNALCGEERGETAVIGQIIIQKKLDTSQIIEQIIEQQNRTKRLEKHSSK